MEIVHTGSIQHSLGAVTCQTFRRPPEASRTAREASILVVVDDWLSYDYGILALYT